MVLLIKLYILKVLITTIMSCSELRIIKASPLPALEFEAILCMPSIHSKKRWNSEEGRMTICFLLNFMGKKFSTQQHK